MTDNFERIREYIETEFPDFPETKEHIGDMFFVIHVIRRGKDHPNLQSANYTFKTYFIDSFESYERNKDEIKTVCDMFRMRAYFAVNSYSKDKAQKFTIKRYVDNMCMGEVKKPWKTFVSACQSMPVKDSKWIVDIDNVNDCEIVSSIIEKCDSSYHNPVILTMPTKSGIHLITHPFNMKQYSDICRNKNLSEIPEVKKNHLTLLYENL